MAKLSSKQRSNLPSSSFVFKKNRSYPVEDKVHARNALARVAQNGSPAQQAKVKAVVKKKYPSIS